MKIYIGILAGAYLLITGLNNLYYYLFRKASLVSGTFGKSKKFFRLVTNFSLATPKYAIQIEAYGNGAQKKQKCCSCSVFSKPLNVISLEFDVEKWIREDGQIDIESFSESIDNTVADLVGKKGQ